MLTLNSSGSGKETYIVVYVVTACIINLMSPPSLLFLLISLRITIMLSDKIFVSGTSPDSFLVPAQDLVRPPIVLGQVYAVERWRWWWTRTHARVVQPTP